MVSSTRINSSTGNDDVQFIQTSDSNGANISGVPDRPVNNSRQLSAEQVTKYREILLNKIPLSQLITLISCVNGDPVAVNSTSKPPLKRTKRKKRKIEYDDEDPIANTVEVTPLPVHKVQYDYPIGNITIGNFCVHSALFPFDRSSYIRIDKEHKRLDYCVQHRIDEWYVSVYSVHLSDIHSIALNNGVVSIATSRPAIVVASYRGSERYSPDIAINDVSTSVIHELIMASASDATSFVCSLASVHPPISTRVSYGTTHFRHANQPELLHPSISAHFPRDYAMNNEPINQVNGLGTKRPAVVSLPSTGQLFGFPSTYMRSNYQHLSAPRPDPPTLQSHSPAYSNSFEMLFHHECWRLSIANEDPATSTTELLNSRNVPEDPSEKPSQLSGVIRSAQYGAANESHYAITVPLAATLSDYAMKYINSSHCELFGVSDMEKEIQNNKYSGCYEQSDGFDALPNIPLLGLENPNAQSGSGFQYEASAWGAGVEHLTK